VVAQLIGALVGLVVAKNLTIAGKKSDE
jgi:hypothetical protein